MEKYILKLILYFVVAVFIGCAPAKNWSVKDINMATGTLTLGMDYLPGESPEYSLQKATNMAIEKCRSLGYISAESIGNPFTKCVNLDLFTEYAGPAPESGQNTIWPPNPDEPLCPVYQLTWEFQCAGIK